MRVRHLRDYRSADADSARRESSCRSYSFAPAASRGNATDNHRGMHRQGWLGAARIAQNELAAMNRFTRFPASTESSCSDGAEYR